MAFMQITVLPMETGDTSLSAYIADIQEILRDTKLDYEMNDMGTVINGSPALLFQVAEALHSCPFHQGVQRVITQISIDERRDKEQLLGEKKGTVASILAQREKGYQ